MVWRVSIGWVVTVFSVASAGIASPGHAAEAYVCGPNKLVYVEAEDLAQMKRTDPCIAAYYGLTVEATDTASSAKPRDSKAEHVAVSATLRPLADADLLKHSASTAPVRQAALASPPVAAPDTDYRNIRVLNATSVDDAWFHHAR